MILTRRSASFAQNHRVAFTSSINDSRLSRRAGGWHCVTAPGELSTRMSECLDERARLVPVPPATISAIRSSVKRRVERCWPHSR